MANRIKGVIFKTYKNIVEMIVDDNIKLFDDKFINMFRTSTKKLVTTEFTTRYYYGKYKYGFESLGFAPPIMYVRENSEYFIDVLGGMKMVDKNDVILNNNQFIALIILKESGFDKNVIDRIINKYK